MITVIELDKEWYAITAVGSADDADFIRRHKAMFGSKRHDGQPTLVFERDRLGRLMRYAETKGVEISASFLYRK